MARDLYDGHTFELGLADTNPIEADAKDSGLSARSAELGVAGPAALFSLPEQRELTEAEQAALRRVYSKLYKPVAAPESEKRLREALETIVAVASGERQVANDDTEGMAWIDKFAREALLKEEKWTDQGGKLLSCGCILGVVSPTCPKGHVGPAFTLKAKERPLFSVDLEDYQ